MKSRRRSRKSLHVETCEERRVLAALTPALIPDFAPQGNTGSTPLVRLESGLASAETAYVAYFGGVAPVESIVNPFATDRFTAISRQTPVTGDFAGMYDPQATLTFQSSGVGAKSRLDLNNSIGWLGDAGLPPLGVVREVTPEGGVRYRPLLPHEWFVNAFPLGNDADAGSKGGATFDVSSNAMPPGDFPGDVVLDAIEGLDRGDVPSGYIDGSQQSPDSGLDADVQAAEDSASLSAPVIDRAPTAGGPAPGLQDLGSGAIDLAAILGEPEPQDRLQAEAPERDRAVVRSAQDERPTQLAARDAAFALIGWSRPVAFEVEGPSGDRAEGVVERAAEGDPAWGFWELIGLPGESPERSAGASQDPAKRFLSPAEETRSGGGAPLEAPAKPFGSSASHEPREPESLAPGSRASAELATGALAASLVWTIGARRKARQSRENAWGDRGASGAPPERD